MLKSEVQRKLRILDFDIEARPLSWYGGDFVTREITAIACRFVDEKPKDIRCWLLGQHSLRDMLEGFVEVYDEADMVTGHYIRGFDLPNMNSALTEIGLPPLSDKLSHDTKLDLIKRAGMSNSQENLAAMLGLKHPKINMTQADWRAANRLTPEGVMKTKLRVIGDVEQHIEMREVLIIRGMLGVPRLWKSSGSGVNKGYHA